MFRNNTVSWRPDRERPSIPLGFRDKCDQRRVIIIHRDVQHFRE